MVGDGVFLNNYRRLRLFFVVLTLDEEHQRHAHEEACTEER
jgi:hypothetical protein